MYHRVLKRRVPSATRKKISKALKAYHEQRRRDAEQLHRARVRSARRGWETRRARAREQARERLRRQRIRQQRERAAQAKEARRLAKWRKSYRQYLIFRVPKAAREELAIPEKKEQVCKVIFDGEDEGVEHFWSNIRYLIGDSVSHYLAKMPADEGTVTVWFRVISAEEFREYGSGDADSSEMGEILEVSYETELEVNAFWSTYFDHAREYLPKNAKGESDGSLLVIKMQVCYTPGEVSSD